MLGTVGYFVKRNDKRLDETEMEVKANRQRINDHMLSAQKQWTDAEQRYAKEATLQSTLERLHARLDGTATKDDVIELRNDIKQIIMKAVKP